MSTFLKSSLFIFVILLLSTGYYLYDAIAVDNVRDKGDAIELYISSDDDMSSLKYKLEEQVLEDPLSFALVSKLMRFETVRPGRYLIPAEASNRELVNMLRSGRQTAVDLTFNNCRDYHELAGKVATVLEQDSIAFDQYFKSRIDSLSIEPQEFLTGFIPNTYQVYWNTDPRAFVERMDKEHDRFWSSDDRGAKADAVGLTTKEVYTLASIVEKESNLNIEKPLIAGVYLNRLNRGIALQADPTVVFATGLFGLQRILNKHLAFDSPYNTYIYQGLPPGPIYMPSIASIDAVLTANTESKYLYFCAKPGYDGAHLFATSLKEHTRNARKYWRWLDQEGIR